MSNSLTHRAIGVLQGAAVPVLGIEESAAVVSTIVQHIESLEDEISALRESLEQEIAALRESLAAKPSDEDLAILARCNVYPSNVAAPDDYVRLDTIHKQLRRYLPTDPQPEQGEE